jgi:predicted glycogen debranching enzyme
MNRATIRFDRDICGDPDAALQREWLETNGIGGFSASTILGLNTRRYHGLLTAATRPPVGRLLLLSKLEEAALFDGERFELSANRYPGVIHPRGFEYLKEFRLDPFPIFTYEVEGRIIEKRVFMVHGENTTVIEYDFPKGCALEIRPLIAFRDYHATTHANDSLNAAVDKHQPGLATVAPYEGLPALHFAHNADQVNGYGDWYRDFEFDRERERGLDWHEDLFNPLVLRFFDRRAVIIASTERRDAASAGQFRQSEIDRRTAVVAASPSHEPLVERLAAAADQYIVRRGDLKTVIAGYHWFSDWGRDTMIALPGLTLVTGRAEVARSILLAFAASIDRGMLPNRFPDAGETPEYNTVDATLWFFEAVRSLAAYTGDYEFIRDHLYGHLKDVIDWHVRGTRYGIRVDSDGLLASGEPGVQLTWMDAKIGDWVVTPRHGKPVEIQALWYNALRIMEDFARRFGEPASELEFRQLADRARDSFNDRFCNQAEGCLYDAVNGGDCDGAIRPNQIFAVSLVHSMLSPERAAEVVRVVERELLTPLGLRSLSPRDSRYRPRYEGGVFERDSSYHQGTVWPWLLGPFVTAYVRVNGRSFEARRKAAAWLEGFDEHMRTACLGQISEIADADAPHKPCGCVAQAWSVAELLRAAIEDVYEGASHLVEERSAMMAA